MADFETARDRVLLGQRRESMVLSEDEKERIAYHEGGHAVLAYVLEHADPVHKVTILPTGMALGVTHQLPMEERHIHPRQYIEDSLCVRMGGRVRRAARLRRPVDRRRQRPRRQHRAGPQDGARVGHERRHRPHGLGLARARSSWARTSCTPVTTPRTPPRSSTTRSSGSCASEEQRAMEVLSKHRGGLNAIARALLDNEIIDGAEVARLVDEAHGSPVHAEGAKSVPHFHEAAISAPAANGAGQRQQRRRQRPTARTPTPGPTPPAARSPCPAAPAPRGPPAPSPSRGRRRRGPRPPTPRPAPRRDPRPARHPAHPDPESNRSGLRCVMKGDGGARSSQTGWRTATSPPSAPPA